MVKEDEKALRMNKEEAMAIEMEKVKAKAEETDSQRAGLVQKERGIDLQLDLEKAERVDPIGNVGSMVNKKQQHQNVQRQQQQTNSEKNGTTSFEANNACVLLLAFFTSLFFSSFFWCLIWFLSSSPYFQFNPILCLYRCLFPAGLAGFLPWGTAIDQLLCLLLFQIFVLLWKFDVILFSSHY